MKLLAVSNREFSQFLYCIILEHLPLMLSLKTELLLRHLAIEMHYPCCNWELMEATKWRISVKIDEPNLNGAPQLVGCSIVSCKLVVDFLVVNHWGSLFLFGLLIEIAILLDIILAIAHYASLHKKGFFCFCLITEIIEMQQKLHSVISGHSSISVYRQHTSIHACTFM